MLTTDTVIVTPPEARVNRRAADRRRGTPVLLETITRALAAGREFGLLRERFEQDLCTLVRARSIVLRDDPRPSSPDVMCFQLPATGAHGAARIEAVFDPSRMLDGWTCQTLEAATHTAALLLELERASGRPALGVRQRADGAAPLIGSSTAIRSVRERIERVAATDFTVLIEGGMRSTAAPGFFDFSCDAPFGDGDREVARARQDAEGVKGWPSNQLRRSSAAPAGSGNSRLPWIELLNQEPTSIRRPVRSHLALVWW